jgi:hypothetical protein
MAKEEMRDHLSQRKEGREAFTSGIYRERGDSVCLTLDAVTGMQLLKERFRSFAKNILILS